MQTIAEFDSNESCCEFIYSLLYLKLLECAKAITIVPYSGLNTYFETSLFQVNEKNKSKTEVFKEKTFFQCVITCLFSKLEIRYRASSIYQC